MKSFSDNSPIFDLEGLPEKEKLEVLLRALVDPDTPSDVVERIMVEDTSRGGVLTTSAWWDDDTLLEYDNLIDLASATVGDNNPIVELFAREDIGEVVYSYLPPVLTYLPYKEYSGGFGGDWYLPALEGMTRRKDISPENLEKVWGAVFDLPIEINNHESILRNIEKNPNCSTKLRRRVGRQFPSPDLRNTQ